jgi:hypothetical protein
LLAAVFCVGGAARAAAQEVAVEFENYSEDVGKFHVARPPVGTNVIQGLNTGVGGSHSIGFADEQALTYTPASFALDSGVDPVVVKGMFRTGTLQPTTGFDVLGQLYITSEPTGHPLQLFGSSDFTASLYHGPDGAFLGASGQTAGGSFWPFIEKPVSIQSNRWYELRAIFSTALDSAVYVALEVADLGADGSSFQGFVGATSQRFPDQASVLADSTWYAGLGADVESFVTVDKFSVDLPGRPGGTAMTIEPMADVTYWHEAAEPFVDGAAVLPIERGLSGPRPRALVEFDLRAIPLNAEVLGATLTVTPTSSQDMKIFVAGYQGDGVFDDGDIPFFTFGMGESRGTLESGVEKVIELNPLLIEQMLGDASHLTVMLETMTAGKSVDLVAMEAATGTPPTLELRYSLPEARGDFDGDGDADGNDFLRWQREESPRPGLQADLADWQLNFGRADVAGGSTVPEPRGILMAMGALAAVWAGRGSRP